MKNFDWQTEEESTTLANAPAPTFGNGKNRHGRVLLPLIAIILLVVGGIYWRLERRADAQSAVFKDQVMAAFRVWQQAVVKSDEELFNTLLVGSEPAWAASQRNLFHNGMLMDRSPLDLALTAQDNLLNLENVAVDLSPDWTSAELTFEQVYTIIDHPVTTLSTPRQIRLAQELTFQRNADRWFLAPAPDDYWGKWLTEEKPLLTLTYPERDADWAIQMANDLEADLSAVCRRLPVNECARREKIELRMETNFDNPSLLLGWQTTLMDGRIFIIPAPSLIGSPVDQEGYELLYHVYITPIMKVFASWVDTPISLPDQELQLICYPPEGRVPKLIRFVSPDEWVVDLPDNSFRYLSPMSNDKGVILQEYRFGEDSSHLRLVLWQAGQESVVYDGNFSHLMLYPVGWSTPLADPHLLLHGFSDIPTSTTYSQIDLSDCSTTGCQIEALAGFPAWSPDGRQTVLQQRNLIYFGDENANPEQELGEGLAPFWIDNGRYGYLRYLDEDSSQNVGMELVTALTSDHKPQVLLTTNDLLPFVEGADNKPAFISYVTPNPADPGQLFIAMTYFANQQRYVEIFSIRLAELAGSVTPENISLQLSLQGATVGYPSLSAASGFVPFVLSTDGRWLSASLPAPDTTDSWLIYARDTRLNETHQYQVNYPSSMFTHPFYDWSKDGNWLVIVDKDVLRLIAPGYNYERLITHNLQSCSHVAWVDPVSQ